MLCQSNYKLNIQTMLILIFALTVALAATSAIFATWTHREVNDLKKQLKNKFDFEESDIYK